MFKFANKNLPSFVKVTQQKYSILPPVDSKTDKVYGRTGVYDFGTEIGPRMLEFDIMIIADNQNDVLRKTREFSTYLLYKDLQPLVLLDEPDKQYMARFVEESEVTELFRTGSATIKFLVPSGVAESVATRQILASPTDTTPIGITNNGTAPAYPVFNLTMKSDETAVSVVSNDSYVLVGDPITTTKSKVTYKPIVLDDSMGSLTGWTNATSLEDGGIVTGTFSSNSTYFQQSGKNYGSGSNWHGASMIRSCTREVQDFEARVGIRFDSSGVTQMGRINIYLLDANNVVVGMFGMSDTNLIADAPSFEARAGNITYGKKFHQTGGGRGIRFLANFGGVIQVSRVGRKWKSYFAHIDSKGRHTKIGREEWYDTKNQYSSKKVAKIQIHIGAFGTRTPVSSMYVTDLKVTELTNINREVETPDILKRGDILTIDNERALVLLNGEQIFSELDPASEFFALESGVNGIIVSPPEAVDVSIEFKERWL